MLYTLHVRLLCAAPVALHMTLGVRLSECTASFVVQL